MNDTKNLLVGKVYFNLSLPYTGMRIHENSPTKRTLKLTIGEHEDYETSVQFHPKFQADVVNRFAKIPKGAEALPLLEIHNHIFCSAKYPKSQKFIDGMTGEILTFEEIQNRIEKNGGTPDVRCGRIEHLLAAWGYEERLAKSKGFRGRRYEKKRKRHGWLAQNRSWYEKKRADLKNRITAAKTRMKVRRFERKEEREAGGRP